MHEHVFVLSEGVYSAFPHLWDRDARVAQAIDSLKEAKAHGVTTIVDLSVLGPGRDVATVREIAQASGMQVIVATGLYTYDVLPHYFQSRSVEHLADAFVHDIKVGVQDTG